MTYKNSAYQRGASRHQPQPPAAEPAKTLPGWLWMVGGILIGTLVVFLLDLNNSSSDKNAPEEVASAPAPQPTEAHPSTEAAPSAEPQKPKYDFYTLLPDSKVILPPGAVEEPQPPAPAASTESSLASAALPAAAAVTAVAAAALAGKAMQSNNAAPPPNTYQLSPPSNAVTVTAPSKPVSPPPAHKPVATPAPAKPVTPPKPVATAPAPAKPVAAPVTTAAKPAPVPAAATTTVKPVATPAPAPAVTTAKPATPAPEATPAPTLAKLQNPPSTTAQAQQKPAQASKLFLQAGSFRKSDDADRTRAEMLLMGVNARIETTTVRGETWHRVLVGPYNSQDKLDQARKELSNNGYSNLVPQKR